MDRRGIRAAVIMVVAFGVSGAGCSSPGDDPGPALPVDPAAIYAQMCARCHGIDGRGDPELKKTLPVRDFSDPAFKGRTTSEQVARTVMAGKNQMPAFGGLLSVPKIQSLSGYVLRLGRTAPRPPAPGPPPGGSQNSLAPGSTAPLPSGSH